MIHVNRMTVQELNSPSLVLDSLLLENVNGTLHWNGSVLRTPGQLQVVFDGGGALPLVGSEFVVRAPVNCQITGWFVLATEIGSINVQVRANTFANWPLTGSDLISGPSGVNLAGSNRASSSNLSSWTRTTLNAGELISIRLNSVSGSATRFYIILTINYV